MHDITRFPRVQDFVSYCRLVKCAKESAGKRYGTTGAKIGNAYLKWAFSEAAVLFLRNNPAGHRYLARLETKHGKGKALTVLAHKLACAVYSMLRRDTVFEMDKFLRGEGRGASEPAAELGHYGANLTTVLCNDISLRLRTLMSPEALCPDPARLLGHLLPFLYWARKSLRVCVLPLPPNLSLTGARRCAALRLSRTV